MPSFEDEIEWDPAKAAANLSKYGVSFEIAATVLLDLLTRSKLDVLHSLTEQRWITSVSRRTALVAGRDSYMA